MAATTPAAVALTLAERREVTHDLLFVRFAPLAPLVFRPGQYTALTIGGKSSYFSIASAPGDPTLEFFIRAYEAKRTAPDAFLGLLWNLRVGEGAHAAAEGMGAFGLEESAARHVMIATTTGITPLRSILRARRAGYYGAIKPPPVVLLYGVSYADELLFDAEFRALAAAGEIVYIPTVSRDDPARNAGWTGRRGRVNNIAPDELARLDIKPEGTMVYLCGNAGMVGDLGARATSEEDLPMGSLIQRGFDVKTQ